MTNRCDRAIRIISNDLFNCPTKRCFSIKIQFCLRSKGTLIDEYKSVSTCPSRCCVCSCWEINTPFLYLILQPSSLRTMRSHCVVSGKNISPFPVARLVINTIKYSGIRPSPCKYVDKRERPTKFSLRACRIKVNVTFSNGNNRAL
ncbi:hypothetical protein PUN28_011362 [Cardiocondyla obscurior]|uniref:Uncharacterized protein n=1 Tax=Cardiocondyla obscurior TaxID=286306 RepID=A0AAW2FFZ8_9HYME